MGHTVTVVGLGNIGSHLVPLLARLTAVQRLRLIDCDTYSAENLEAQAVLPGDVSRYKAVVQAEIAKRIRPDLSVEVWGCRIEEVPWGALRSSVVLGCLDSLLARRALSQVTHRLGIPLIDAGVSGDARLVRVSGFAAHEDEPCMQCSWDDPIYDRIETVHPCSSAEPDEYSTDSTADLGAFAAALLASECRKQLAGTQRDALSGSQVLHDLEHHTHFMTRFRRNPSCRFVHGVIAPERLEVQWSDMISDILKGLRNANPQWRSVAARVMESSFALRLSCRDCGSTQECLRIRSRVGLGRAKCPSCGGDRLLSSGFHELEWLTESMCTHRNPLRPRDLGLLNGDVLAATDGQETKFYLLEMRP